MISVKPGDIVCAKGCSWMGPGISTAETRWQNCDHDYCHSFVVTGADGAIINTLETVQVGNIYTDYAGQELRVGRAVNPYPAKIEAAITEISKDLGAVYPAWRLGFFALDAATELSGDGKVCSERAAYFGWLAFGFQPWERWAGQAPGHIAFVLRYCSAFNVVFEGKL